ncbi:hypothetical protein ACIRPX_28775 [Streptomyces sp. NPDC101225]|uniref:hypothetical protein n=1 Tax=Streptomyces sp. NPDC101225 TaxID=3366135 RepID=UPI00381B0DF1
MGEYVGVDPVRVRKLADRLGDLERALAKHGALIRKNFKSWDSGLDLSPLAQQTRAVGQDARDMSKRADLARNLEEAGGATGMCTPDRDVIDIPWDMKDVSAQSAKEAQQEAATLKKALDNPKADGSRADIAAISRSLADHRDDPAYLAAFASADAARVGEALHEEDGTHGGEVLNQDAQRILSQYAAGVNGLFTLQTAGRIPPNGDMWSVGMLFKYGPDGKDWDAQALSSVGGAMLDWRKNHEMRPTYSQGQVTGAGYVPGGYVDPDDTWYKSIGLAHSYVTEGMDDAQVRVQAIDANDPSAALMQRVSSTTT